MKLLVPDRSVKSISEFTGLTTSLLYMERRESGKEITHTGTRNTIDRLDLFCEYQLSRNPDAVRIVGDRYTRMYRNHVAPALGPVTLADLLYALGDAGKECGEAIAACSGRSTVGSCTVEVAQAKASLERALAIVTQLEEQNA